MANLEVITLVRIVRRCHIPITSFSRGCAVIAQCSNFSFPSLRVVPARHISRTFKHKRPADNDFTRSRKTTVPQPIEDIVIPIEVIAPKSDNNEAFEMDGVADSVAPLQISTILNEFCRRPIIRQLAEENGMNSKLFMTAFRSFRSYCLSARPLDPVIAVIFSDIVNHGHDVESLFVYFLSHARKVYPHLESIEDLRIISDLTEPHNWYPEARMLHRKIIFHAGPTNSGKTYQALKRFTDSKSGVYCGPLKLLASEVYTKTNELGVKCDMVTGEERRYAVDNYHPSAHIASTVEMLSTQMRVEVAVIDEIQMLRDEQRGWAWTRALLGAAADEVHLCGEMAAVDIVRELLDPIGEHVELKEYGRLSSLTMSTHALGSLDRVEDGDCIVCFSRNTIFSVTRELEKLGIKNAVIYGDLPPGTKLGQASRFNDPNDPTNVLVSTDAVGMGLNLNIRRIIFYSIKRPPNNALLPNHIALQIAGRAGRFGTKYAEGKVMTMREEDMGILRDILSTPVAAVTAVGIAPTFEQLETFSFHLPNASFINLLDIFVSVCSVTEKFFICTVSEMKALAELIAYVPLPLKVRYTFCTAPIDPSETFSSAAFVKMARRFSSGQALGFEWFRSLIGWPIPPPQRLIDLLQLEQVYDIVDLYLWLSFRFQDMFPGEAEVRHLEHQLDKIIEESINRILDLLSFGNNKNDNQTTKQCEKPNSLTTKSAFESNTKKTHEADNEVDENAKEGGVRMDSIKLPCKRRGKRKKLSDHVLERGLITPEELLQLREELRHEEYLKLRSGKR